MKIAGKIYRIELPIPFPPQTINGYFVDEFPRTLIDTGIKTGASFEALIDGIKALGSRLNKFTQILDRTKICVLGTTKVRDKRMASFYPGHWTNEYIVEILCIAGKQGC
jgi:hypothetical protein